MKAEVNQETCIGCGLCAEICPAVFVMTDNNVAETIVDVVPADQEAAAGDACSSCPVEAITLTE